MISKKETIVFQKENRHPASRNSGHGPTIPKGEEPKRVKEKECSENIGINAYLLNVPE